MSSHLNHAEREILTDPPSGASPYITTVIAGRRRGALSGAVLESTNPSTGDTIAYFPRLDREDVKEAVNAAEAAGLAWSRTTAQERADKLYQFADRLLSRRLELATLDSQDNGSPLQEMLTDVDKAATQIRYFAGLALQLQGQTVPSAHGRLNFTVREPYGVVGRIIAFNHPLMFAAVKIAAPLMAGNTVLLKPSEHTSLSALAITEDFEEIFGPGIVQVITGLGSEAGDAIVTHPAVRRIAFIGSAAVGRKIQERAASVAVKNVTLELGGKNAVIVMQDADIALAVDGVIRGMNFAWQGQSCGSTSRLLVHHSIYDSVVEQVTARIQQLRTGPPWDSRSDLGAMVNEDALNKVLRYIEIGKAEGAALLAGGTRLTTGGMDSGNFVAATLFGAVAPDSRLATEEIFGPVLAAMPFDDYEEAVRITNATNYGLTASIYTTNLETALKFAAEAQVGYVWVNEVSIHVPGAPYGGCKDSGVGREEDLGELESYTQVKNVHVNFAPTAP